MTYFFHLSHEAEKSLPLFFFFYGPQTSILLQSSREQCLLRAFVVRLTLIPVHFSSLASNPAVLSLHVEYPADHRDAGQTEPVHMPTGLGEETALRSHIYVGKDQPAPSKQTWRVFLSRQTH